MHGILWKVRTRSCPFDDSSCDAVQAEVFFRKHDVSSLVVDLRDNPGGDLTLLLIAINFCIPEEGVPLFSITSRTGVETYASTGRGLDFSDIAILVNGSSASSSEVMAGTLSDAGYATVIGTTTYGKARGQTTLQFAENDLVHMSMSEVKLPKRGNYHGEGITPDLTSEMTYIHVLSKEDLIFSDDISAASSSLDILKLQKCLYAMGYLTTYASGEFDTDTKLGLRTCLEALNETPGETCTKTQLSKITTICETYLDAYFTVDTQLIDAVAYLLNE